MIKSFLSKIFGIFVKKRNQNYDKKDNYVRVEVPVISVGNLSVGGTGKTPFVQMLTKFFKTKNYSPGIVGRGYKRESKGKVNVGDYRGALVSAREGGDEMVLLAESLKVPVIAHDSKSEAAVLIHKEYNVDLVIVDDGFQHRKLFRDLDIVLIDKETNDNPKLMPEGRLREPLESIKRAHVVSVMGNFELNEKIKSNLRENCVIIRVKPIQANPYDLHDKQSIKIRETKENNIDVFAFAGIAKPERFFNMISELGFNIIKSHAYKDHYNYRKSDVEELINKCKKSNCKILATTEKDAAKIIEYKNILSDNGIKCVVFPITLTITDGKAEFFKLIGRKINYRIKRNKSDEK